MVVGKLIVIVGGCRSGKSCVGREMAAACKKVAYFATAEIFDQEIAERVIQHRKERPKHWKTFEDPRKFHILFKRRIKNYQAVVLDGTALWLSGFLPSLEKAEISGRQRKTMEKRLFQPVKRFLKEVKRFVGLVVVVADELGQGVVPVNSLARFFRDVNGQVNQMLVAQAQEAYFVVAGRKIKIK